jgi:hypothetical protein
MDQRPDYVPPLWTRGTMNRRFWSNPRRVFWWLVLTPAVSIITAALMLIGNQALIGLIILVTGVINAVQAAIYAPRAHRASRHGQAPS